MKITPQLHVSSSRSLRIRRQKQHADPNNGERYHRQNLSIKLLALFSTLLSPVYFLFSQVTQSLPCSSLLNMGELTVCVFHPVCTIAARLEYLLTVLT